jgi:DNA-binding HxlR family transcriptional regulator
LRLTASTVNGSGNGLRSGAQTLMLLAAPLNCLLLEALAEGPKQQTELRHATGSPAQTTLRAQLKRLHELGAIAKRRRDLFPGVLEYELTAAGHELLFVLATLESWLGTAPKGPLALGSNPAKAAVKALAEGWSTTMLRALATGPLSLTKLDRIISDLSYPAIERRLAAMRLAHQIVACPGNGRGTPYAVTDWLRLGVGPLAAAARWERRHTPEEAAPIGRVDVEAAFLLALPLLQLPAGSSGTCRVAVDIPNGMNRRLVGVMAKLEGGRVASCSTQLEGHPEAWLLGSPADWMTAVIEHDVDRLELGGDGQLGRLLVEGLHRALFAAEARV